MAKSKRNPAKKIQRKKSSLLKILEWIVFVGTIAGVLINYFKNEKRKK
jgi:hypothetical protein